MKIDKLKNPTFLSSLLIIFLSFLILISNAKKLFYHCFHAMDLAIYQEAIYRLADGQSWNPFVTVRGVHIFNDHFDPIIYLAAPFVRLFSYHPLSTIIFEWLWPIGLLGIIFYFSKLKKYSFSDISFMLLITLFTKGLLTGLEFPIHPATWVMIPIFLICYYILEDNFKGVFIWSLLLCLFKECYPFVLISLSCYYLFKKTYKRAALMFFTGLLFVFLIYKVRPLLLGPDVGYGRDIVENLLTRPLAYFLETCRQVSFVAILKIFYPFLIPLFLLFKKEKGKDLIPLLGIALFLAPLFVMHFLVGRIYFHYSVQFMAALLPIVFYKAYPHMKNSAKLKVFTLLLFVLSSSSVYTKMIKVVFFNRDQACEIKEEKLVSTKKLEEIIKIIPKEKPILSTGGVLPWLTSPERSYLQLTNFSLRQKNYEYLLLEKEKKGVYPFTHKAIENLAIRCRPFAQEVLLDDASFYFFKGNFTEECLQQDHLITN